MPGLTAIEESLVVRRPVGASPYSRERELGTHHKCGRSSPWASLVSPRFLVEWTGVEGPSASEIGARAHRNVLSPPVRRVRGSSCLVWLRDRSAGPASITKIIGVGAPHGRLEHGLLGKIRFGDDLGGGWSTPCCSSHGST